MKHKRFLLLVIIVAVVALGAGLGWFFIRNTHNTGQTIDQDAQNATDIASQQYFEEQQAKIATAASNVNSIEDLRNVAKADRGSVGLYLAELAVVAGDTAKADAYLGYLMTTNDVHALDASLKCYQYAKSDERRQYCLDNMNRLAVLLGVIKQGEVLPGSYYAPEEL